MLYFFYIHSKSRKFWILLTLSTIVVEYTTFFIQNFFLLKPCVLCVYQKCALYGITIAGLIAVIAPIITVLRLLAIFIWIYSSYQGLLLSKKYIDTILHPTSFATCDLFVNFPDWLPLDKWLPNIFRVYGNCSIYKWYFLSLEIS